MYHRSKKLPMKLALTLMVMLILNSIALFAPLAPAVQAQAPNLTLRVTGPGYVQAGQTLTYELTVQNSTSQTYTGVKFFNDVPANTTYVSGGTLLTDPNNGIKYVEFTLASLAPNTSTTVSWVARANSGLAVGTLIENNAFNISESNPGASIALYGPVGTGVEASGTLVAVYKNASDTSFDVNVHGFQFENYANDGIPNPNDDLSKTDVFEFFGPGVCQSGNTAATCVLSAPANSWLTKAKAMSAGGHCDGMAATSLRLFNSLPFRQYSTPASFQAGAASTINLNFPAQPIENYVAHYFQTQSFIWDSHFAGTPTEIVQKLTQDFNQSPSKGYTVAIFKSSDPNSPDGEWSAGHAIVAYGIETVSPSESRILVYDNNFPKQRKYITVNTVANTWRYVTASTPGQPEDAYEGSAVSANLRLVPLSARALPAGQYFACPFCPIQTVASAEADASDQVSGEMDFQFTGEGSILIVDDQGRRLGDDLATGTFVNEIPEAEVFHFQGGLGKDIPPFIDIPFTEHDDTFWSVFVHGRTVVTPTSGSLHMQGPGFSLGVENIELDANEVFTFTVSPDGDHISFVSSETEVAPTIHIAHDPVHDGDPSVIFEVSGEELFAGERIALDLDPVLERIEIDDTGLEEEDFLVTMDLIFPDGDMHVFTDTVIIPAGVISSEVDFGAWDGLLTPPLYLENVLQNPSVNHRLMLQRMSGVYDSTPQANAPAGVYHVDATFTNVTEVQLTDLYFTVADLAAGNVLLNADGSPAGAGAKLSVPNTALGEDGLLHVNESVTVRFSIGLASADTSALTINANGTPHDWTHEAPPLAGQANNASFVFPVRADNPIFLPLVAK